MFRAEIGSESELRPLHSRHAPELFALTDANREHLRRWLPWVDGTRTVVDTLAFIDAVRRQDAGENGFTAGIWCTGRLAGVVGFHQHNHLHRSTSLGYWLGREFEGRGLVTRATRLMVDHAFGDLTFNRVEVRCAAENARSRAIPQRLGFVHEGTIRQAEYLHDRYVNHMVWGMLARDWRR